MFSPLSLVKLQLTRPTVRRWVDLILLAAVAVLLTEILGPELGAVSHMLADRSKEWPALMTYLCVVLVTWVISSILIRLGGLHLDHFRLKRLVRFPPAWFAAIVGSVVVLVINGSLVELFWGSLHLTLSPLLFCVSSICGGLILAFAPQRLQTGEAASRSTNGVRSASTGSRKEILGDPKRLDFWLREETPIRFPSEDIFDVSIIARRIAKLLSSEEMRAIGIVGSYGGGKTSLLNLTEYYLDTPELGGSPDEFFSGETLVCRVDGWGRVKGSIASQVLAIALEQVRTAVDCLSIISLPTNYRKAIGGMGWPGSSVLEALFQASHDPVAQLDKLDGILGAARLRLVIFLEDLDRNTSDEIIRDEIPSLLDRLRKMTNISFVLAIGTEQRYSQILIRICDYVEAVI